MSRGIKANQEEGKALKEAQAMRDAASEVMGARIAKLFAETDPALSMAEIARRVGKSFSYVKHSLDRLLK